MQCLLCQIPMDRYVYKNGYWIYRCPKCHLGETDLKKNYGEFVTEFYSKGYYSGDPTRSAYVNYEKDKPLIVRNMLKFLSVIEKRKPKGRLLDVGCAMGYFVELALVKGYDAYGFDPSTFAANKAKKLVGPDRIKVGRIDSVTYPKASFDVITLFDVFEHLQNPLGDMRRLARLLKKDGLMIIATGNTQSLAAKIFRRRWTFFIPPQHIFFFHKANVTRLLAKAELRPTAWYSVGKWLSLGYVLHLARTTGESRVASEIYNRIEKSRLMHAPLFVPMKDNMVIIVEKA